MKDYTVQAFTWIHRYDEVNVEDETSVVADTMEEAIETARAVFTEAWTTEGKTHLIKVAQLHVIEVAEAPVDEEDSARVGCTMCHWTQVSADAVGYYYPNIDEPHKRYVCEAHARTIEQAGLLVFRDDIVSAGVEA